MCLMTRTIWPVGHGAFYTETFNEPAEDFSVVYDCGGMQNQVSQCVQLFASENKIGSNKPVIRYLFISHFHRDHINGIPELLQATNVQNIIIPQLENKVYVEAFMQNLTKLTYDEVAKDATLSLLMRFAEGNGLEENVVQVKTGENKLHEFEPVEVNDRSKIVSKTISSGQPIPLFLHYPPHHIWQYIPVNVYLSDNGSQKIDKLLQKLKEYKTDVVVGEPLMSVGGKINLEILRKIASDKGELSKLKEIYNDVFGANDNIYSMPVYSGPVCYPYHLWAEISCNSALCDGYSFINNRLASILYSKLEQRAVACLYMGDFGCNQKINQKATKLDILKDILAEYWYQIGMLQIPHHASVNNHSVKLYRKSKICFANINDHGDISFTHTVIRDVVAENCIPFIVTENDNRLDVDICF